MILLVLNYRADTLYWEQKYNWTILVQWIIFFCVQYINCKTYVDKSSDIGTVVFFVTLKK